MTKTHPFLAGSQAWVFALRVAMGYPRYSPAFHTIAWCGTGRRDIFQMMDAVQLAADMARDIVQVTMAGDGSEAIGISLAVRKDIGFEWLQNAQLYTASETSKLELLAGGRRWFVGPRLVLTSAKLPPKSRREHGEQIAMRRWRQVAATMMDLELQGNLMVLRGERYADAIRHEDLRFAA